MSTTELLQSLRAARIKLSVKDGKLSVDAPKGALTAELRARLTAQKAELIELLSESSAASRAPIAGIPLADRSNPLPLSYAQQRIWFLEELEGGSSVYNIPWAMRVRGAIDPKALQRALNDLAFRHESLRTTFAPTDAGPVQVVEDEPRLQLEQVSLPAASSAEVRSQVETWAKTRFNLRTGPLLKAGLIEIGRDEWVLTLVVHHIVADGWSLDVLQSELFGLYAGHVSGTPLTLTALPLQLADYAAWQRSQTGSDELARQLDYWQEQLRGAPAVLELPTDRPRPSEQSYRGSHVRHTLPGDLSRQLKELGGERNVTLFMLMLAAFHVLLARYSGQDDIVVGTPVAGRQRTELEGLIGLFLNTLAIRADLTADPSFAELLTQIQATSLDAFEHQDLPFDRIVEALDTTRDLSHSPVFQVQFILQNAPAGGQPLPGLQFEPLEFDYGTAKFDLTLAVAETTSGIAAEIEYATDLFDAASIERLLEHYEILLGSIVRNPELPCSRLALLSAAERSELLTGTNSGEVAYPSDATLQSLLENQAQQTPAATALIVGHENVQLSYAELNARANQLAHWLRAAGVQQGSNVGVYLERSADMVIALLGIIKAGGAYVPLDPDYPEQRLQHMLEDAAIDLILSHSRFDDSVPATSATVIALDAVQEELARQNADNPVALAQAEDVAYVIFTSGSTGRPKGVMNEHRGICNRLLWMQDEYGLDGSDSVLQKTPFSFDVSVWEFFWPLLSGATLVMAKPGGHKDSDYLCTTIQQSGITTLHFVPSMLQVFLQNEAARQCGSLRRVICSGEALSHDLQTRFYLTLDAGLHNLYGPTEAAIDVTYWACPRDSRDTTVPIGHPVANTHIYIVEPNGEPAPRGVAGELWIGGVQVARGYAGRPDLTAERFIPDPFSAAPDARVYRTGDLARFRNDGAIEFLGRIDQQVKLRGFRIELGEIEATLDALPGIEQSLVLLREDVPGNKRLVAYLTTSGSPALEIPHVREALQAKLPEYMVPAAFVVLDAYPLLPNGKVDRSALPEPTGTRDVGSDYVPPSTPVEIALAQIWSDLLRVDRVGIHDNFFELGGDSILSIQIITRAARADVHLQPKQVFRYQTIAELAEVAGTTKRVPAEQGLVSGPAELTPIQHWFFAQDETTLQHFNQSIRLTVKQPLSLDTLQEALHALLVQHDALRLCFTHKAGRWQQHFAAPTPRELVTVLDISADAADAREAQILGAANELQASLDIGSGCLLRALLCRQDEQATELLIVVHHLAMDGLSWRVLLEDLTAACTALSAGERIALPPKTSSFKAWSAALHDYAASIELSTERHYWTEQSARSVQPMPVDFADGDNSVATTNSATLQLGETQTRRLLQDAPRAYRTQINDLLLTAFALAWERWTGQQYLLIDLEGHGREEKFPELDVSRTVGWFTTLFPVRLETHAASLEDAIKRTKEQLRAVPDRGFGFGILRYLTDAGSLDNCAPEIMFNYLGQFDQSFDADALFSLASGPRGSEQGPERQRSHLLEVNGGVYGGALSISLNYSAEIHSAESVQTLAQHYESALLELIDYCTSGEHSGYTPTDFPLAALDQAGVDALVAKHPGLEDIYPVTPMQHGMLFHSLLTETSADYLSQVYLTQVLWELQGDLDPDVFRQAWQAVTDRHASLRTAFHQSSYDEPLAIVSAQATIELDYADWRERDTENQAASLEQLIRADRENSFALEQAPLMRLFLRRTGAATYKFLWSHHHAIMDGWSIPVVLDELFKVYEALRAGTPPELRPARNYGDYIEWLQAQDRSAAETYWRTALDGFVAPTPLPGATQMYRGQQQSAYEKAYATLTPTETQALRDLAKQLRLTLNSLAQGVWSLLLSRYTGEADVLFGATTSGRPAELKHVENMVGLFLNTIPVRARLAPEQSARDWFAELQEEQLAARQHEYASLTDVQSWSSVPRGTPLFHTLLIFENYPDVSSLWEDRNALRVTDMQALGWTSFPLSAAVSVSEQLILRLAYDTAYFDSATIRQLSELYCQTLTALIAEPDAQLRDLLRIPAPARIDATPRPAPRNTYVPMPLDTLAESIVKRFERQVATTPAAPAVHTAGAGGQRWTYAELNHRANSVAAALLALEINPGDRVGLLLGHDTTMLAGLLGTLKAGLVYVPLDPATPAARLQKILDEAEIDTLVHAPEHEEFAAHLAATAPQRALALVDAASNSPTPAANPNLNIPADALAYILFTSGSTGTPKGVMQVHRNVLHHVRTYVDALHIAPADRLSLFSPYGFDAAVMDIYGALLTGACLCPVDLKNIESADAARDALHELDVSIFHATPTVYRFLFSQDTAHDLARVRLVVLGGEEARPGDLQLFQKCFSPGALFVNGLGPTESTLALQYFADHSTPIPPNALPVGIAVAGTEILLMDEAGEPAGLEGEICIRSPFVTPGYWHAPELTAAAFTTDREGRRIYKTGDLGRYDINDQLIFIGRRDTQIKVRGHRIEPGEIEAALGKHPDIARSVVVLIDDAARNARLTAYCVMRQGAAMDGAALRRQVQALLPDYMVPAAFVALSDIPLTPNGKLDRRALPAPVIAAAEDDYVAPSTPREIAVAKVWVDLLGVERVGLHDDFFALGGHSLIATQLMSRLRDELNAELPLRALFDRPTVAGLCSALDAEPAATVTDIPCRDSDTDIPLSFTQQRLWFLDQLEPGSSVYNLAWAIRLHGTLNESALQGAINDLVARHESLRTHFVAATPHALQVIAAELRVVLQTTDLSRNSTAELQAHLEKLVQQPFDLSTGPLFRTHLLQLAADENVLLVMTHHIISDNWSSKILMRDLQLFYGARADGVPAELPDLPVQYGDYAVWQRNWLNDGELDRQLNYWQQQLADAPTVLDIPTDRPRPPVATNNGGHVWWQLGQTTTQSLRDLAQAEGCTLFMVLIAAYAMLLSRYSGQNDLLVGTPIAGRKHRDLEDLIGFFVNTLVIRAQLDGTPSFREVLQRIRNTSLDAFANQDLPFEKLVEELQPDRDMSRSPLFQAAFILQNTPVETASFAGIDCSNVVVEHANTKFDLTLGLWESDTGLGGSFEYNTDLFDQSSIERMLEHYTVLLNGIVQQPAIDIGQLPLLSDAEKQRLLVDWNKTHLDYASDTLHGLFERSAAATPDAIALWADGDTLSYKELNRRANKLAAILIEQGVGPDVLAGICCERRKELIIGMLAVLKAGGAYVPLDPAYPAQRVAYMLEDSQATILLTLTELLDELPERAGRSLCLDQFDWSVSAAQDANPLTSVNDSHLAYTIYTSGSTGLPKGVMIEHRNAVALAEFTRKEFLPEELAGVLASTSVCFDLSVYEIFCTLGLGGRVILVENALALPTLPPEADVRLINTVPSAIAELLRMDGLPDTLITVNLAGEPLATKLVNQIYAAGNVQRVYDLYGPSEDTTYSTWTLREPRKPATIGKPIHNTQAYIVDAHMQPAPIGVPGELYLGGAGVTRGYFGKPELTQERYVTNPFSTDPDQRLYRTGDKARYRPDGNIEFLGRIDQQVKLRGFRIELGEIEAAAERHPSVKMAVAIVREDTKNDPRLVAYLVAESTTSIDSAAVNTHLRKFLPAYMVPTALVVLDELPMTPNGKLDRKALPAPEWSTSATYVAPRNEQEEMLTEIFADVLHKTRVGIHDDFFALGGHSLLATQVIARIRDTLQADIPLRAVFDAPTIAALAPLVTAAARAELPPPVSPRTNDTYLPLSFAQQRQWLLAELDNNSAAYNIPIALRLSGALQRAALQTAVDNLVQRHESLRTTFAQAEGKPTQLIAATLAVPIHYEILADADDYQVQQRVRELATSVIDLRSGPLLNVSCLELSETEFVLTLVIHHIVADQWALGILLTELAELYNAACEHRDANLPQISVQYADYAIWQHNWLTEQRVAAELKYWEQQLADAPSSVGLATDRPRPPQQTFAGDHVHGAIDAEVAAGLRTLAQQEQSTLFMVMLAAFNALLQRYSGDDDIVIGTPVSGRRQTEVENIIGMFLNTLTVRTDLSGEPSFSELVARVKHCLLGAYAHQDLPFERLVEALQPERDMSRTPLFQVLFTMQQVSDADLPMQGLEVSSASFDFNISKFDLSMFVANDGTRLNLDIGYNTDLYDRETIEQMLRHFQALLTAVVADPQTALTRVQLLDDSERQHVLADFNATKQAFTQHKVHELVAATAAAVPGRPAVQLGDISLSYAGLNARANRLARHLQTLGAGDGVLVGISMQRSIEQMTAVLAVLKTGAAYVPIDPNYPAERVAGMLSDSGAPLLLTETRLAAEHTHTARTVLLDTYDWQDGNGDDLDIRTGESVYVIYTSGSTGRPKGVELTHAGLNNLIQWQLQQPGLNTAARTLQFASLSFDVSFQEMFTTWAQGGTLVLVDEDDRRDMHKLAQLIMDLSIERLFVPFAALQPLAEVLSERTDAALAIRDIVVAGEQLQITPAVRALFKLLHDARLHNHYGPSETHVVTACTLTGAPDGWPALPLIGTPVANTRAYVLDPNRQPVPIGVPGELFIGGIQVAKGYLHRPELTAEKFTPDGFVGSHGEPMYATGDRVRFTRSGALQYLGRTDDQVKWRGFRIEPGEIESALTDQAAVRQAVVMLREDQPGAKRLVAYVVGARGAPDIDAVLTTLHERLPDYMVPSVIVPLETLPLTPTGKVARRALPVPDYSDAITAYTPPRNEKEATLVAVWADVLGITQVGIHDDFFRLGGHSLLATQVISRVRDQLNVDVELRALFNAPTVAGFAATLGNNTGSETPPIVAVPHDNGAPLSFAQQRLWFLDKMDTADSSVYNVPGAMRLHGELDPSALQSALDALVQRHESLRTLFLDDGDEPIQRVDPDIQVTIQQAALQKADAATLREVVTGIAAISFDLAKGPLIAVHLFKLADHDHLLVIVMHHIISDGWSIDVLNRDLAELYAARVGGRPADLPQLPIQYPDFAIWQRGQLSGAALNQQIDYWRGQLAGAPALLELPTDFTRPTVQTYNGTTHRGWIDRTRLDALQAIAQQNNATLFMALLAIFDALLARYAGQEDVVVGSPIAGRQRSEVEGLIGFFVNTLVLRGDLSGAPSFTELLARTRATTLDAYDHQDVPFEKLVEVLQPERNMSHTPLFQVMFMLQQQLGDGFSAAGLEISGVDFQMTTAKFDLILSTQETPAGLITGFSYNTDLFAPDTIARMAAHFERLVDAVIAQPNTPVAQLSMLDTGERRRLLEDWNQTAAPYPDQSTLAAEFEKQAAQTPERVALRCDGTALTYAELNSRANQLAHLLREHGVGEDALVTLCFERSIDAVLCIVAIVKAGGAYVPLDPSYPDARLNFMLEDTASKLLLTHSEVLPTFDAGAAQRLNIDELTALLANQPTRNPEMTGGSGSHSLAYVIYTSGSTGRPKGTLIEQKSVLRLVKNTDYAPLNEGLAIGMLAPMSFDASTLEIWGALLNGGEAVIFGQSTPGIDELRGYFARQRIDLLFMTTTLFNSIVDEAPEILSSVRTLLTGGEAMSLSHIKRASQLLPDTRLANVYGPTESTTFATHYPVTDATRNWRSVPIGRPIRNTTLYVLDPMHQPVPVGVAGELYIGGDGLARGYLNLPELTKERFIDNPFGTAESKLYKTGDRVRYLPDGNVEFMGRVDDQVKLRGFRIELGEIEAALRDYPSIVNAAALVHSVTENDKRLVAYVVGQYDTSRTGKPEATAANDEQALMTYLSARLPAYMVPSTIVFIDRIPKTINGKLDKSALPTPTWESSERYVAPTNELETTLCSLWQEALNVERVGIHDDFFALGGHSLLIIRLLNQMQAKLGMRLEIATVFENPTVAQLARQLGNSAAPDSKSAAAAPGSTLMPIRTTGSRPPLFCIHGEPLKMAQVMDVEQPLYGIYFSYDPQFRMPDSLEELAAAYLKELRKVQPVGPYHLVGYCLGGLAAFEMARQLLDAGEEIAYLALIDPTDYGRVVSRREWVKSAFAVEGQRLNALAYFTRRACKSVFARTQHAGRILLTYGYELLGKEIPFILREVRHTGKARSSFNSYRYRPTPLHGVLFRPDLGKDETAELEQYWNNIFSDGVNFIKVSGLTNHFQFMQEPFHSDVSALINAQLEKAANSARP